jgi:hypothetical protein
MRALVRGLVEVAPCGIGPAAATTNDMSRISRRGRSPTDPEPRTLFFRMRSIP